MSKTPIMILQELMMKGGEMPLYDITDEHSGTHLNSFTYTVRCKGLSATATASSKKVAKQNAAEAMLHLLGYSPNSTGAQGVSNNLNKILTCSTKDQVDYTSSSDINFINYVGKLQELCVARKLHVPVYEIVQVNGPPHLSHFTIRCSIKTLHVDGTATTKKQAKQNAAKQLLEILMKKQGTYDINEQSSDKVINKIEENINITNNEEDLWNIKKLEELGILIKDLHIDDSMSNVDEIKTLYKELQQSHKIEPHQVCLQDYHTYFKQKYVVSDIIRENLLTMCDGTKNMVSEAIALISREFATTKRINFPNHNKEYFAVGFRLESIPVIFEIGIGKTKYDAEVQAVQNIINTILLMIS